jgi:carboxylesterase type B
MYTRLRAWRTVMVCTLVLWGGLVGAAARATAGDVVPTDTGVVRGSSADGMRQFLGIPYAAPPVGELRWQPPQPAQRWQGVRDATQFANHCPQPPTPFGVASVTEDCLYLNVYTPEGKRRGWWRPVMVWFHGGALFLGESDDYGPARLVDEGVVVVTVNYRLGILGFLAHPALSAESSYGGSGNYGIMDQQAALRWVRRNISRFGGDPHNVTIFGESAGGLSVHTHLASPESNGLFHRAIIQSGAYALDQPPLEIAELGGTAFAAATGCGDQSAGCLRSLTVEEILANQSSAGFIPNLDGRVLQQTIRRALASGEFNRVPVMQGTTHDEWRLFVALDELVSGPLHPEDYVDAIASTLGVDAATAGFRRIVTGAVRHADGIGWEVLWANSAYDVANDVNLDADVVGSIGVSAAIRPFLYIEALQRGFLINDLVDPSLPPAWADYGANGINGDGWIAAGASSAVLFKRIGDMPRPTAPANLTAVTHEPTWVQPWNAITLTWESTSPFTKTYSIERSVSGADDWQEIMKERNVLQYNDTTGDLGQLYDYRVIANGLAGPSVPSHVATARFPAEPVDTTAPMAAIVTPADGAEVSGRVPVVADFYDEGGVEYAEISVSQGSGKSIVCSESPGGAIALTLSCTWRTKRVSAGSYVITAYAFDVLGNWTQQSVTVTLVESSSGGGGKGGGKGKP